MTRASLIACLTVMLLQTTLPAHAQKIGDGKFDLKAVEELSFMNGKMTIVDIYTVARVVGSPPGFGLQVLQPKAVGTSRTCGTAEGRSLRFIVGGEVTTASDGASKELSVAAAYLLEQIDGWETLRADKRKNVEYAMATVGSEKFSIRLSGEANAVALTTSIIDGNKTTKVEFSDLRQVREVLRALLGLPEYIQNSDFAACF